MPERRSSSSDQTRARSPTRIAAPVPNSVAVAAERLAGVPVRRSRCAWPGRPRRVSAPSMTSSWTSALACTNSSAATARSTAASSSAGSGAGRGRRASPSRRRPGAAACRPRPGRATSSTTGARLGVHRGERARAGGRGSRSSASVTAARSRSSSAAASGGAGCGGGRAASRRSPASIAQRGGARSRRPVRSAGSAVRGCRPASSTSDSCSVVPRSRRMRSARQSTRGPYPRCP